ncbi:MAG: hypothetical protein CMJ84_12670 [Planctomycetes bacterium]|jgi:hypothetical protein|nr:hypothetical protein [Planctomycetota bacterium]
MAALGTPRGGAAQGEAPGDPLPGDAESTHNGPRVAAGASGPARFVPALHAAFDPERALASAAFADRWYRAPGNEGYEATLEHLAARLREAGFGEKPGLELRIIETEMDAPAWTPKSASLLLHRAGTEPELLHGFDEPADRDRVMLPINAPSADVSGPAAMRLSDVEDGSLFVTLQPLSRNILRRARKAGARAVLSAAVFPFTVDPSGGDRHLDAILFRTVAAQTSLPVGQISRRTFDRLGGLVDAGVPVLLTFKAEVELREVPLRTLVAAVVGSEHSDEAVAMASHVQEPGAGDNASGIAGLAESAVNVAGLIERGELDRPARTLVFIWGDEIRQSSVWLEHTARKAIAGISADMLGQSPARTGAIALLEREPDPGALAPLPPDAHTPWGAGEVSEEDVANPSGLNLVARTALSDVARFTGGWTTSENPWEGGSDHDVFLEHGIPGVLIWHFTDYTYHTGLDRMEMLDGEELRRSCTAVLATALAVADPRPADLERYLTSLEFERELRVGAAHAAGEGEIVEHWERWSAGAARWLKRLCW